MSDEPTPPGPPSLKGRGEDRSLTLAGEEGASSGSASASERSSPLPFREGGPGGVGRSGPLLAVDYGTKRIGLAVCDPDRVIASPLGTAPNDHTRDGFFAQLFRANRFVGIVVGLPLHASGEESPMSAAARAFAAQLAAMSRLPFVMWDERHTSFAAESALLESGLSKKKRKDKVDRVAAQMILQTFIDAGSPTHGSDPPPPGAN